MAYLEYIPRDILTFITDRMLDTVSNFMVWRYIYPQDESWDIHLRHRDIKAKIILPDKVITLPIIKINDICHYNVEIFKYFDELEFIDDYRDVSYGAAMYGNVNLVEYIAHTKSCKPKDILDIGIAWGHVDIIDWVYKHDPDNFKVTSSEMHILCIYNQIDCFKYIHCLNIVGYSYLDLFVCVCACIECNGTEILELMKDLITEESNNVQLIRGWFYHAIKYNRHNIVRWLVSIGINPDYKSFRRAVEYSRLATIKYFDEISCPHGDNILSYTTNEEIIEYLTN